MPARSNSPGRPRVFISYSHDSSEHEEQVRRLADRLRQDGIDAWIDAYDPAPADGWPIWMDLEIQKADFVLLICTETYLRRVERREEPDKGRGVLWEAKLIYNHLYNYDAPVQRFIPILFQDGDSLYIPKILAGSTHYQTNREQEYQDLRLHLLGESKVKPRELDDSKKLPPVAGFELLEKSGTTPEQRQKIGERLNDTLGGDPRRGVGIHEAYPDIDWCRVPANNHVEFKLTKGLISHRVEECFISKYPVTGVQFNAFVNDADGYINHEWWKGMPSHEDRTDWRRRSWGNRPQTSVTWYEATAFCAWLSTVLPDSALPPNPFGDRSCIRLPYEWEWQNAATGGTCIAYPWGEHWQSNFANTSEAGLQAAIAVGMFPLGRAPCGALDMTGNVHEWCANEYSTLDNANPLYLTNAQCSVRGGSWKTPHEKATCLYRHNAWPLGSHCDDIGFRIVCVYDR